MKLKKKTKSANWIMCENPLSLMTSDSVADGLIILILFQVQP